MMRGTHGRHAVDMVRVTVRQKDAMAPKPAVLEDRERSPMLQPGIYDQALVRVTPMQDVAVLVIHVIDNDIEVDKVAEALGGVSHTSLRDLELSQRSLRAGSFKAEVEAHGSERHHDHAETSCDQ